MNKKFSMRRRLAAFALGGCALFGAANAENWIPVGSGELTIFIPQFNFQANKTSTSDYTLSWNAQSGATSYKVERLFAGITPATADEIVTEWRTVADITGTSLNQSHNLSTQDLDGHQLYRLSSCIQTVCTELDELYYFTDKNDLSTTVPQNFTLTHLPPPTSAKVASKTFTASADSEDNPYAYGKGYSFITGHENPNSAASASKIAKYEAEYGVQTVSKSGQVSSAVTYITRNEVLLTWDPVEHATHYVVSRVPDRGASPTFERLYGEGHSLFASDTSFQLKLQAGVYDFVVYACNGTGFCGKASVSITENVVIEADSSIQPQNFAVPLYGYVDQPFELTWEPPSTMLNLLEYQIAGELAGFVGVIAAADPNVLVRNTSAEPLAPGRQYCYKIRAVYDDGNEITYGQYIVPVSPAPHCVKMGGEPVLPAPDYLTLLGTVVDQLPEGKPTQEKITKSISTPTGYTLSWATVPGADYYQLDRDLAPGSSDWSAVYVGQGTHLEQHFSVGGFEMYRVSACKNNGQCGNYRRLHFDVVAGISEKTALAYKSPACLNVPQSTEIGEDIAISWCAPQQSGVVNYELTDSAGNVLVSGTPANFAKTLQGLSLSEYAAQPAGSQYCFNIQAYFAGDSTAYAYPEAHCGTVQPAPIVPTNLSVSQGNTETAVDISWTDVNPNPVTHYELQLYSTMGTVSSIPDSAWLTVSDSSSTRAAYSFSGVVNQTHYYRVRGCNVSGSACSDYSSVATHLIGLSIDEPTAPVVATAPVLTASSKATGAIEAAMEVDASGAASWSSQLTLPKGKGNFQPSVAVSYNSLGGNGVLGVGWSLGAGSEISRCRRYFEKDGEYKGVALDDSDELCLDGQRLVPVSASAHFTDGAEYRPESDPTTRVTFHTNSASEYFTVDDVNARTRYYGNTSDSIVADTRASKERYSWLLNREQDSYGNNIDYSYTGSNTVQRQLDEITYSGNTIDFVYTSRTDDSKLFYLGNGIVDDQLLTDIIIKNHQSTAINSYHFTHVLSGVSDRNLVTQIQRCDGVKSRTCLQPTTFSYEDSHAIGLVDNDVVIDLRQLLPGVDSDMASDYCDINHSKPKTQCLNKDLDIMDSDGDGISELLVVDSDGSTYYYRTLNITPDGYTLGSVSGSGTLIESVASNVIFEQIQATIVDSDGDGTDEILWSGSYAAGYDQPKLYADLSGDGIAELAGFSSHKAEEHAETYFPIQNSETCEVGSWTEFEARSVLKNVLDYNGDGLLDRLFEVIGVCIDIDDFESELGSQYYIMTNTTAGGTYVKADFSEEIFLTTDIAMGRLTLVGDINGDGYTDFSDSGCTTGTGVADCRDDFNLTNAVGGNAFNSLIDINHDGRADWVYAASNGEFKAVLSDYNGTDAAFSLGHVDWTDIASKSAKTFWVDLDGDGQPALVYFDVGTHKVYIRHDANTANKPTDVMLNVDNGMGLTADFDYAAQSNDSVYSKYNDADTLSWGNSPVFDSKGSLFVVEQFSQDITTDLAGDKVRKVRDYQYEGLRYQGGGRGSLGFAKIIEKNSANNQTATTWYKQQYPFTGQVSKQTREVKDSGGANVLLYEMNVTDWLDNSYLSGQVREASAKTTQEQFFTFDGSSGNVSSTGTAHSTKVTTLTRDKTTSNYSTLGQKLVTTTDHHSGDILTVQTDNDFNDEDTSNWYIQRPTAITQTRTLTYAVGGTNVKTQSDSLVYNAKARLLTKDRATVADHAYMREAYGYDTAGNVTRATQCSQDYASNCHAMAVPTDTHTDKLKFFRRVITNYDSDNRYVASTSNGLFTTASLSAYNALGLPGTVVNEKGVTQSLFYDAFGRKYFTASTEGSYLSEILNTCTASTCPDNASYYITKSTPNAADIQTHFDLSGREVANRTQSMAGTWSQVVRSFDSEGQLISKSQPHWSDATTVFTASVSYDDIGRMWREIAADGTTKTISFTGFNASTSVVSTYNSISSYTAAISTVAVDQTTVKTLNGFGQLKTSTDANAKSTSYIYGAFGKLLSVTDMNGVVISNEFDDYARRTQLNDPDKGIINYVYNGLQQLVERTAPGSVVKTHYFDAAGREVQVHTANSTNSHTSDFVYNGALLSSDNSSEGFARSYAYDGFGRTNGVTHTVDLTGEQFSWQTSTNYDQFGRVFQQFDASGNNRGTQNSYSYGHLTALKEAQRSSTVYYQATGMNVFGQFSSWTLGNGHTGTARYDAKSGYLQTLNVDLSGVSVQDHVYEYDGLGNLHARIDNNGGASVPVLSEIFTYDSLNRLKTVNFNTVSTLNVNYFDNGNMSSKSDVASGGAYAYGVKNSQCSVTPGAHALSGIGSTHKYCYDNRGNQIGAYVNGLQSRSVDFTVYDKPSRIWSDEAVTEFSYDATFSRFRRTDDTGSSSSKSYYIGGNEIVMHDSGLVEYKRYIGDFALNVIRSNATQDTHYLHRDHIGSIAAIANDSGTLTDKLSYDAFGKRREGSSWTALQSVFTTPSIQAALAKTHQGFTGHEHVDHADIIHMGGRIYDPAVGRFVQADPLIQAPENGQSLNRYSYVFNNPLSLTDPSGYKTVCKQADQRGGNEVCTEITERQYEGLLAMANEIRGKGLMNAPIDDIVSGLAAALEGISTWSFDSDGGGGDIEQAVGSDEPTEEQTPSPYAGLSVQQANNQIASSIKLDTKDLILEVAHTMEHVETLNKEFGGKAFKAELTLTLGGSKYDVNNGASLIYPDIKASIGRDPLSFEVQLAKMSEDGFQINSFEEVAASWTLKAGAGISDSDTGSSIGVNAAFDKDKFVTGGKVCGQGSCVSTSGGITHLGQGRFSFIAHQAGMGFKG